jgi:hypothetical protein
MGNGWVNMETFINSLSNFRKEMPSSSLAAKDGWRRMKDGGG